MAALDDGTLLDRWREHRDGDAFAELARRHSTVVYDITCRVLGDQAGAEDVLQEALLSLALEPTRKPVDVGVVAWLARFAICRARNRRASERSRARRQIVVGLERPEESMPDEALALNDELEHALAGCDPDDRAILAMRFLHGWEYDRIASALSIHEGAARVRVHRALQAVRSQVKAKETSPIAPALAALPIAALPTPRIDAAIRAAVEIATVKLGAAPNGVEHATAASRSFRVAMTLTGAALLFVGAAGATIVPEFGPSVPVAAVEVAAFDPSPTARVAGASLATRRPAAVEAAFRGTPRPSFWDHGVLRGVAEGVSGDTATASSAPSSASSPSAAAPAAGNSVAAEAAPALELPSASRPSLRGACAAKGDSVSSDGERAGALGGSGSASGAATAFPSAAPSFVVAAEDAPRAAEAVDATITVTPAAADAPAPRDASDRGRATRRRVERPTATIDALPVDTQALVGKAEEAVRELLAAKGSGSGAAGAKAVRRGIRDVRQRFAKMSGGDRGARIPKAARARRSAVVREVLSLLAKSVLADGRVAGELRWPAGADLESALATVIRVLGTKTRPSAQDVPSGAAADPFADPADAAPQDTLPQGAAQ